jgi:hypothetical protein
VPVFNRNKFFRQVRVPRKCDWRGIQSNASSETRAIAKHRVPHPRCLLMKRKIPASVKMVNTTMLSPCRKCLTFLCRMIGEPLFCSRLSLQKLLRG